MGRLTLEDSHKCRQLKQAAKRCMQELPHCSVVLMKRSHAKVLRLNLGGAAPIQRLHPPVPSFTVAAPSPVVPGKREQSVEKNRWQLQQQPQEKMTQVHRRPKHVTRSSSLDESDEPISTFLRDDRASSSSSSTATGGSSSFLVCEQNPLFEGLRGALLKSTKEEEGAFESFGSPMYSVRSTLNPWLEYCRTEEIYQDSSSADLDDKAEQLNSAPCRPLQASNTRSGGGRVYGDVPEECHPLPFNTVKSLREKFVGSADVSAGRIGGAQHAEPARELLMYGGGNTSDVRNAVCLLGSSPSVPPPLCSICRNKAPVFGKPPRWFSYGELEEATGGFAEENFLAEGGFGWVHRGVLRDGQAVAVKRLKSAATGGGDEEFRTEVEVLSRAQHRNVVMLVGFCAEGTKRALVYEYICNGSLALHLYGRSKQVQPLDWHARHRIAVGAARGLRYLHEDCRVGFIHRDVRPSNILLTHDFEPLVGDFGFARWHMSEGSSIDTRIIGTFGYLAPEYVECGLTTEKADVYAFGVVLLELVTGRKAVDVGRPKGEQFLTEWARPMLALAAAQGDAAAVVAGRLLDPRFDAGQVPAGRFSHQPSAMVRAASLCLRREPHARPSMSKVLRMLEGDQAVFDPGFGTHRHHEDAGSGRFGNPVPAVNRCRGGGLKGSISHRISGEAVARALYEEKNRSRMC